MENLICTLTGQQYRAAYACMAKNDVRYYLQGACLHPDGNVYATNGHVLYRAPYAGDNLATEMILPIVKLPVSVDSVEFWSYAGPNAIELRARNKSHMEVGRYILVPIDGRYPNCEQVINSKPENKPANKFGFDPKYLALVAQVFGKNCNSVTFNIPNPNSAAHVTNCKDESGLLVIMPVRI